MSGNNANLKQTFIYVCNAGYSTCTVQYSTVLVLVGFSETLYTLTLMFEGNKTNKQTN